MSDCYLDDFCNVFSRFWVNHHGVIRDYAIKHSARVDADREAGNTGMVIVLGEPIRPKHVWIVRNRARFWECCLELFYGFAEVVCSPILGAFKTGCTGLFRFPGASGLLELVGREKVSRSRAQKGRTSQKQHHVLSLGSLSKGPTCCGIRPLQ